MKIQGVTKLIGHEETILSSHWETCPLVIFSIFQKTLPHEMIARGFRQPANREEKLTLSLSTR